MRILILQDFLRNGGTERQSILLAGDFSAAGHVVTLLVFRPGGVLAKTVPPGVRLRALQPFDTGLDWLGWGLRAAVGESGPDVVLCMGRMANCHAWRVQRWFPGVVVVCTMRTGKKLPPWFRRSLRETRHTIANSHEAARVLEWQYALPPEKISVIYNAAVFPAETQSGVVVPERRSPAMLCAGMFRPEKNQRELIEIVAKLPRNHAWELWLAGDGPERAHCERLIAEKELGGRVRLFGFLRDPRRLYRAAHVAVLTSESESLSNFLIEAHAHGVPSVAYAAGGVAECGGVTVPPGDQQAFLAALEKLLFDDAAHALASARVIEAAKQFTREKQHADYEILLERLTEKN